MQQCDKGSGVGITTSATIGPVVFSTLASVRFILIESQMSYKNRKQHVGFVSSQYSLHIIEHTASYNKNGRVCYYPLRETTQKHPYTFIQMNVRK